MSGTIAMSEIPQSIVGRIRKLLALSENNSNEHEANAAAAKAQALLTEYNLEMSGLDQPSEDSARGREDAVAEVRADWQVTLMAAIARANFCMHWTDTVRSARLDGKGRLRLRRRHSLVGRHVNMVVTREMYDYLLRTMERLCPYTDRRARSARSWFDGCSDRLRSRLEEQRAQSEADSRERRGEPGRGSGSDLVLSDVYSSEEDLNNDLRYGYAPGTTAARNAENNARWAAMAEAQRAKPVTPKAAETEKERLKREAADKKWYERYEKRQQHERARVDWRAYSSGSATGSDIGLDRQVRGADPARERLG